MKISGITTRLLAIDSAPRYLPGKPPKGAQPVWHYPLITVETDEGIEGYSMGYGVKGDGRALALQLHAIYADRLLGADPLHSEAIWQDLRRINRSLYNLTDTVLGVIDVALWDIRGKVAGLPIAAMLGIRRTRMPSYQSILHLQLPDPEQTALEAQKVKEAGFHGLKLQFWDGPERDIPRLYAARDAVGADFPLMHDAGGGYDYATALKVGRVLDELGYHWFEEPIPDGQIGLLRRLADTLALPILVAETAPLSHLAEYLRQGAGDMVRGDVNIKGGITGLRKALAMCELFGLRLEIHTAGTPLLDVANLHVACTVENCEFFETHHPIFRSFALEGDPLGIDDDGYIRLPSGPGLGVALDWDWITHHTDEVIAG